VRQLSRQLFRLGKLGRGLALAFVGVALAAIAVNTAVSAVTAEHGAAAIAVRQERTEARAIALASSLAYSGNGWRMHDLMPVLDLADRAGAGLRLLDSSGRDVCASPGFAALPRANAQTEPVFGGGLRRVGTVTIRFGHRGLGGLSRSLAANRWHEGLISAVIAALIALVVSVVVARAISAPLERLLDAVRARGAGGRSARIGNVRGVGVVRELQESFNNAANAVDEQERLQRDLVANVAHELRTPVAVLQASHEAMLDGVTVISRENVESARDETLRLSMMIEDLQRLAAAESAALRLKPARHDLAVIAAAAAAALRGAFAAAGIGLQQRLRPAVASCDADRMHEVVVNLLANALNFTPAGGVVVVESAPDNGGGWIRVTDSGIGISEDELPHVTERFYRGPASQGMSAGSGIGLAIVAELVRVHRGDVRIVSEPGAGTQVTVTLPG
jgi:two-component system, OmpR family, sensor histidine kinase BaeS